VVEKLYGSTDFGTPTKVMARWWIKIAMDESIIELLQEILTEIVTNLTAGHR